MAYDPKDNPLRNVKVEIHDRCHSKSHFTNLLIWGGCTSCRRIVPVPDDNTPVFERIEHLKKLGV
ncbi:hypothetical protein C4568_03690 [Candidatus Parcubacteria bacterium]|nr:MAG: hypothetical protein C4568_03690 [Candidatus Parcubacteria bacterium]